MLTVAGAVAENKSRFGIGYQGTSVEHASPSPLKLGQGNSTLMGVGTGEDRILRVRPLEPNHGYS